MFLIPRWIRVPRAPTATPALLFGPERVKPNQQGSHRAIGWEEGGRGEWVSGWMVGGGGENRREVQKVDTLIEGLVSN